MIEETDHPSAAQDGASNQRHLIVSNDNDTIIKGILIDARMLMIARLTGHHIAREEFAKRIAQAANDNFP